MEKRTKNILIATSAVLGVGLIIYLLKRKKLSGQTLSAQGVLPPTNIQPINSAINQILKTPKNGIFVPTPPLGQGDLIPVIRSIDNGTPVYQAPSKSSNLLQTLFNSAMNVDGMQMQPDGRWFKISYGKTKNLQSGWVRIDDIMESPSFPMGQMLNLYTKNN